MLNMVRLTTVDIHDNHVVTHELEDIWSYISLYPLHHRCAKANVPSSIVSQRASQSSTLFVLKC